MGAWIETYVILAYVIIYCVAPCMGAWIETCRVCPLIVIFMSLPAWERGLKLFAASMPFSDVVVAPCMGAWIETADL